MIETERLVLREWREADLDRFAGICADPVVMATLGPPMSRDAAASLIARMHDSQARDGHCFWAVERKADAVLVGWCGLVRGVVAPIEGRLEIGWRLASELWGQGYATEAARATLVWAATHRPLEERIWAITSARNDRSRQVMERLGMQRHDDLDFDHPRVPAGSPLKPHVTYSVEHA